MPTERKFLVFISSTSDLQDERNSIELPRSMEAYRYEQDRARKQSPRDRLEEVLKSADAFVGIFGARWGSPYPDCDDLSIVEWEFETARAQGKELFPFVKANLLDVDPNQQRFLERLRNFKTGSWVTPFASRSHLQVKVLQALLDWLIVYWERDRKKNAEAERSRIRTAGRWFVPIALSIVVGSLGLALIANWLTQGTIVWACILLMLLIVAVMSIVDL